MCEISCALVDPRQPDYVDLFHVGGANIKSETGELVDLRAARDEALISGKFHFSERAMLYSKIRPYLKKVARPDFVGLCSADIYPLASRNGCLHRDFLYYLLLTEDFTGFAIAGSARAGMPKVHREHLFHIRLDSLRSPSRGGSSASWTKRLPPSPPPEPTPNRTSRSPEIFSRHASDQRLTTLLPSSLSRRFLRYNRGTGGLHRLNSRMGAGFQSSRFLLSRDSATTERESSCHPRRREKTHITGSVKANCSLLVATRGNWLATLRSTTGIRNVRSAAT